MVAIMTQRTLKPFLAACLSLGWVSLALAQDIGSGTTGTTGGTSSGSGTVNTSSLGGSGGSGSFGGGVSGGTSGDSFLGTGGTGSFITSGYEPGALGHAAKAGAATTTTNTGALFSRFYVNPYALGINTANNARPTTFGTPIYASLYPGTQTTTGVGGAAGRTGAGGGVGVTPGVTGTVGTTRVGGGAGGITGGIGGLGGTGTTTGFRPPAAYTTAIGFKYNPTTPTQRQLDLQAVLARSSTLASRNINVDVDGNVVILRGQVTDPADRRLAENLLRLTPGVRVVRNEVTVAGP